MRITDKYILFWSGPFSQWYKSPIKFKNFNNEEFEFKTAEHFMMYHKALVFQDYEIAKKILQISDPKEAKALGRLIKNFDVDKWDNICKDIVTLGNYLKFTENNYLRSYILKWKNLQHVEASPVDSIWGIGLHYNDPLCDNKGTWKGKNYLGECLDKARSIILGNCTENEVLTIRMNVDSLHF